MSKAVGDGSFGSAFNASSISESISDFLGLLTRNTEVIDSNFDGAITLPRGRQDYDSERNNGNINAGILNELATRRYMAEIVSNCETDENLGFEHRDCVSIFMSAIDRQILQISQNYEFDKSALVAIDLALYFAFRSGLAVGNPRSVFPGFKSEAEKTIETLAKSGREGGRASGEARRAKAIKEWKAEAKESAIRFRKTSPDITQELLAEKIADCWKSEPVPAFSKLVRFIRDLESSGELQKRRK